MHSWGIGMKIILMLLRVGTYSCLIFPISLGVSLGFLVRSLLNLLARGSLSLLERFTLKEENRSLMIFQAFLRWIILNYTENSLIQTKKAIALITSVWLNLEKES